MQRKKSASTKERYPTKPRGRVIETEADIEAGVRFLRRRCRHMRAIHDTVGNPPLRRRPPGLAGLARIITGQQLSIASADAIWARLAGVVNPFEAGNLLQIDDARLRAAGLSRPKIKTLRCLAKAVSAGELDLGALPGRSDEDVHQILTALSGIGPWTADIYILFCIGRADAWAPGDLALQIAVQHGLALKKRPAPSEMTIHAEAWRPWRGVAARLLWSYYRQIRRPGSGSPV